MTTFQEIYQKIISDDMNKTYTTKNIMPLYQAQAEAKVIIIGQAPGRLAEESHKVWNDKSGDTLREWLGISRETFYNSRKLAHLPMDFYYPGKGKTGDLAPRKGFAQQWHPLLLNLMPDVELMILVGNSAQTYYLGSKRKKNLTETVRSYQDYLPHYFPIVHPSPLNFRWQHKNPWFEAEVIPVLQEKMDQWL